MKALFIADIHLRAKRPLGRTDVDYFETQFKKLEQIKSICEKEKIKTVYIGGDVFDSNKGSLYLLYKTILFFRTWAETTSIYTVAGNHDMLGQNIGALNKTFLGIMFATGFMQHLTLEEPIKGVFIKGIDFRLRPDTNYMGPKTKGKTIIISHDMITPKANFPFEVLPIDKIQTNADLVLCAHYHIPFTKKKDKTTFINPGSLMRIKHTTENVARQPQVVVIDVTKDKLEYKIIKLRAKKGVDVFDVDAKRGVIEAELKLEEFFSGISSMNDKTEKFDVETALKILDKEKKISKEIFEEALNRIQEAKDLTK